MNALYLECLEWLFFSLLCEDPGKQITVSPPPKGLFFLSGFNVIFLSKITQLFLFYCFFESHVSILALLPHRSLSLEIKKICKWLRKQNANLCVALSCINHLVCVGFSFRFRIFLFEQLSIALAVILDNIIKWGIILAVQLWCDWQYLIGGRNANTIYSALHRWRERENDRSMNQMLFPCFRDQYGGVGMEV